MNIIIPKNYKPCLDVKETEEAIKLMKDYFQINLAKELNLRRVSAPLYVRAGTGINDTLTGIEKPISFIIKNDNYAKAEIVQSLAKWKRMALADYGFKIGEGLYTDMNAIRPDEVLDNLHSIYVDQWDWEKIITKEQRNLNYLKEVVRKIYKVIRETELVICRKYSKIKPILPKNISFVHTEELEERYPDISPKEREYEITKEKKAVFLIGIGWKLKNGRTHEIRAPDYDDWSTLTEKGRRGLNGDIIVWYPVLNKEFELCSMGIRVDKKALLLQLKIMNCMNRTKLKFHKALLNGKLPLSVGGGIGQSRLSMFYLHQAHIGEAQSSIWPEKMIEICKKNGIFLL
jgi:aspartate--ammonia ligase